MLAIVEVKLVQGKQVWVVGNHASPGQQGVRELCECKVQQDAEMIAAALNSIRSLREAFNTITKANQAPRAAGE